MIQTTCICSTLEFATRELELHLNDGWEIVNSAFFECVTNGDVHEQCFQAILKREVK